MYLFLGIAIILIIWYYFRSNRQESSSNNYQSKTKDNLKEKNIVSTQSKSKGNKYNNKALILDTETTGLTAVDEFIEITAVLVEFDKQGSLTIIDKYTGLREPDVDINPEAQNIHNITHDMLKDQQIDYQRLYSLFDEADFLVAHNASFDKRFIEKEFKDLKSKVWLCSMNGIRWRKRGFNSKGLQNLLDDHDIDTGQAHRAESDVMALIELLNSKASPNTTYFNQLLRNNNIRQRDIEF